MPMSLRFNVKTLFSVFISFFVVNETKKNGFAKIKVFTLISSSFQNRALLLTKKFNSAQMFYIFSGDGSCCPARLGMLIEVFIFKF